MSKKKELRWEDAAVRVTPNEGWMYAKCRRWYGDGPLAERQARYCCHTDGPCECGNRRPKHYTKCDKCRAKERHAKYMAMPEVEWNGNTPLTLFDADRYFFSVDELIDYAVDQFDDSDPTDQQIADAIADLRLCLCKPWKPRFFEMLDLCDDFEDIEIDDEAKRLEKEVNAWLEKNCISFTQDNKRPAVASVLKYIDATAPPDEDETNE